MSPASPRKPRVGVRATFGLAALAAAAVALTACSSSGGGKSSTTPPPAGGTSAVSSESSSSSGNPSSSSGNSAVDQAAARVASYLTAPTDIPQTTALPSAPPAGKTIVLVQCDYAQCVPVGNAIKTAAALIKWNVKVLPFKQADAAGFISAMKQALQYNPVAVAFAGQPYQVWQSIVPAYQKAHVAIIPNYIGPAPADLSIVPANIYNPDDLQVSAGQLADWFVANSDAKGHALAWGIPGFPILGNVPGQFEQAVSKQCSQCKVTKIESSIADSANPATVDGQIISALQRDPSIKYVMSADGALNAGLSAALKTAGLSDIKYMATLPSAENVNDIKQGADNAVAPTSQVYTGWATVDVAIRWAMNLPIKAGDGGVPHQLVTKDNAQSVPQPVDDVAAGIDVPAKFKTLWHLS